ncbi:MAG TPA: HAD family hydrolase [Thermomicrobiaceae bacterium]|nr:HAD family hydrolase [Thermomicrobiaceae bacterium]
MSISTVFFDVGETLIDETRQWGEWADWLGVPRLAFFAVLGGVIARGEHHRRVFEICRPGFDYQRETARRMAAGQVEGFSRTDLYPDALPCLETLRDAGFRIGLAGNQPPSSERWLQAMGLPVDLIASSASFGVEKPAPEFFTKVSELAGCPVNGIAYVGDRLDNDALPAIAAGMLGIFIRRGPWGYLQAEWPEAAQATARIGSLAELPNLLKELSGY